jgi:Domain of unknown function (DUF4349)
MTAAGAAAGAVAVLFLSGCGGGGTAMTSNADAVSGVAPARDSTQLNSVPEAKFAPGAVAAPPGAADVSKPGAPLPGVAPKLTKSASLDLQVKDVAAAAARVRGVAAGLQAHVLSEQIGKGGPGDPKPLLGGAEPFGGFGTLTLSVPADKLDTALDQLAKIGTVLQRNTSSQDVTSQYVDTESRLKTMRASVERVRALMAQAKDLGQVVALESEMSRRQADLESLESQLTALKTSVERSTLAVSLSTSATPGNDTVAGNGFLAGLRSGWDAFTASAAELLKVIGAAMPFALFFALIGAPAVVWWRRRRANQPASAAVVPTPAVPTPAA